MHIRPGYRNALGKERIAFLDTLSPTRREEVQKALTMTDNESLDTLIRHLDSDPDDPVIRLLLDESMKDAVLHQAAGSGYRSQETVAGTRGDGKGKYLLKPDTPTDYQGKEQAALEILAARKELDYIQGAPVTPIDESSPIYQRIARHNSRAIRPTSIIATGEGGIVGNRGKHPDLPPQTLDNATIATNNQMYDNLVGNERGEQPVSTVDRLGNRSGLPVEHKLAFNGNEALGRDPDNRMLGSTVKNSILRDEPSETRQQVLLMSNLAQGLANFEQAYGVRVQDYMKDNNWKYSKSQVVMPDFG